jgi:hypothetical protein
LWDNYHPREFKAVPIPIRLKEAMNRYTAQTGVRGTGIFDMAIFKLMEMWDEGKFDAVENALIYNPPPHDDKTVQIAVRFTGQESFDWVCSLEQEKAIIASTRDFILRALSWYLREKNVLDKHQADIDEIIKEDRER